MIDNIINININDDDDEYVKLIKAEYNKKLEEINNMYITEMEKILKKNRQDITNNVLDKIIELYPNININKNKIDILNNLETKKTNDDTDNVKFNDGKEIVVEGIIHNKIEYYRDKYGGVHDKNYELVGLYNKKTNTITLFDEMCKIDNDTDDEIYKLMK